MSKGIELTPTQIKALQSGATMFLFFANNYRIESKFDEAIFPINKGDKDIFVKEEFQLNGYDFWNVIYKNTCLNIPTPFKWIPASQMTKEQSRYSFSECIDVKVVRVQDWIKYLDTKNKKAIESFTFHVSNEPILQKRRRAFESFYNQQMKEQNINRTYEDNDYVFLIEFA